ncbi:Gfo/Idh/MocA family protein [Kineococcus sp. SYSU DK001]|uniref:Gfo/Idh/MocA family protein n=1 Tax=Kineococcus sp. SYSU DK001 TaxID=3383122 RepID=UPI003D7C70D4
MTLPSSLTALPDSRRPDPRSVPVLRWGLLGTGWIAERFAASLRANTDQQVVAVGSRTTESARRFATAAGIATAHGSYEALVDDPQVDVVYVALPHHLHRGAALQAIAAGKHVLVEKPLALDRAEAQEVFDAAAAAGVAAVEAYWTAFLPRTDVVRQVLENGWLGDVRTVVADHGEHFDPPHRILDPALAGGSLLDLGTYLTTFATWVLGPATSVFASGEPGPTGVNAQTAAVLTHARGARSSLHTTLEARTPTTATVGGTEGTLFLPGSWMMPGDVLLTSADGTRTIGWTDPQPVGHGALHHTAVEVALRLGAGELQTPLHSTEAVLTNLAALDEITRQVGVSYAQAKASARA